MKDITIRCLIFTDEFNEFYNSLKEKEKEKVKYVMSIIRTQKVVSEKFAKKLENTDFYEMRVSVSSKEYRTIIFSLNADNLIEATEVILLNSFLKKDTKDYKKALEKAVKILTEILNKDEND